MTHTEHDRMQETVWTVSTVPLLADLAAEAIRVINHRTLEHEGYLWPSDLDATIGALHTLAERLPQLLQQAETWLDWAIREGKLGDDRTGAQPSVTVEHAQMDLHDALIEAGRLAAALKKARSATSHMTGVASE